MKVVNKKRPGFTLTEILVVCGVSAVFLGTAIMLFTNFRQGYSRSENVAVLMQESALFIARLRTDLNNAVLSGPGGGNIEQQLQAFPDHLTFNIYSSRHGRILPVVYNY
ncbi:MAG TPA: prepilin-type N-terminal cleavage/methylation domain-containing protein, partial [Candidatus Ozemobacteraceae bacterium]|nr:prepilin-type N-terminal cleavage/methylation domain-containing protein [Candidatus Ozemobacteraceae bacterium]